jgi:tetratricopeptide (TPR) repeat protein
VGHLEDAEKAYRRELELAQKLAADFPSQHQFRFHLPATYQSLGMFLQDMGRGAEAEAALRRAMEESEKLISEFPKESQNRLFLANTCGLLANSLQEQARYREAATVGQRGVEVLEKLTADFPKNPEYRSMLGPHYTLLGMRRLYADQHDEAEKALRRAADILEKLAQENLASPNRGMQGAIYGGLGFLMLQSGRAEESLEWYSKAITTVEPMSSQEGALGSRMRQILGAGYNGRAKALEKLGRHAEALKDWDTAVEVSTVPGDAAVFRSGRAAYLARTGNRERAAAEAAKAVADATAQAAGKDVKRDTLLNNYRACAIACGAVQDNTKLADEYAAKALNLLRRVTAMGYKTIDYDIKTNDDLKPFAEREDVKNLMSELTEKKQ